MLNPETITRRIDSAQWPQLVADLDARGWALLPAVLSGQDCQAFKALYPDDSRFRNRIVMQRHGYGRGEYRYFAYPLPAAIAAMRSTFYSHLVPVANRWQESLRMDARFPDTHAGFIERCHAAGQLRPTPLLLQYGADDFNCLHQDLYGEHQFPFQVAMLLSQPGADFEGGEFVLTEQRPRMQSRVTVVPLQRGDAVVFAVNHRPAEGVRGYFRMTLKHGVSTIRSGNRHTLGIIFHDAL